MKIKFYSIILFMVINNLLLFGLDFKVSELISIPGNNRNIDISEVEEYDYTGISYICWENQIDSMYTIYLKKIDEKLSDNIVICRDTLQNIYPQIAYNRYNSGYKIVWLSKKNDYWQILLRNYDNDTLSKIITVADSIIDCPKLSLSIRRVAYIDNGNLLVKSLYPEYDGYVIPIKIDSINCSNPNIYEIDDISFSMITYEKGKVGEKKIAFAEYSYDYKIGNFTWSVEIISDSLGNNLNPKFDYLYSIVYQSYINNIWKIKTYEFGYNSKNSLCNFTNPDIFTYPVTTKGNQDYSPFFCVFDTDSIENNQEIFIETITDYTNDTLMNISNFIGYDEKPLVTIVDDSITIFWEHTEHNKTDIWCAKDKFLPYPGGGTKENKINCPSIFSIQNNYPNPFNPSTVISFQVKELISRQVVIKIYNSIGDLVRTIVKDINGAGNYLVSWDGKSNFGLLLPTGNYFYTITYGNITRTGKMCLIK